MEEDDEHTALLPAQEAERKQKAYQQNIRRRSSQPAYQPPYGYEDTGSTAEASSSLAILVVVPISLMGVFVANADGSLVVASSQQIASEFDALFNAQWLVTSYVLAQCASQPLYGKLSDVFGRKLNLVTAYTFFAAGSFVCGSGREYWQVLAGRAVSGIGGAGMTALVSVIISDMVPVRDVAAWRSYVNVAATTGRALGGPVGGWLCDTIGWRWCFYGQVPLTIAGLLLILWKMPSSANQGIAVDQTLGQKLRRIDYAGGLSLATAISAFLLVLDFSARGLTTVSVLVPAVASIVLATIFVLTEKYWAREPILPLRLLVSRVVLTSYLVAGFQIAAQYSTFYSTPLYYQIAADSSVAQAGLRLVPAVCGNVTAGLLAGWTISRTGRYKYMTISASGLACLGYALITARWCGSANWAETLYIFFGGFGSGAIQSTSFIHLAANLELQDMAIAGTTLYLFQNVFLLIGVQSSSTILHAQLRSILDSKLEGLKAKAKVIELAISSVRAIRAFPPQIKDIVVRAYIDSLTWTFGGSLALAFCGLLVGISIRERRLD